MSDELRFAVSLACVAFLCRALAYSAYVMVMGVFG